MARWLLVNRQKNQDRHYLKQIYACAVDIEDRRAKLTKYTEFLIIWSSVIQMGKQHNWISDCRNGQRPGLAVEEEATPIFTRPPADFINIIIIGDHHYWKQPPISHPYGKCEPFLFSISGWIKETRRKFNLTKRWLLLPLFSWDSQSDLWGDGQFGQPAISAVVQTAKYVPKHIWSNKWHQLTENQLKECEESHLFQCTFIPMHLHIM